MRTAWFSWCVYSTIKIIFSTIIYQALKNEVAGPKNKHEKKDAIVAHTAMMQNHWIVFFFDCPYLFGAAYPSLFLNQLNGSEAIIAN